MVIYRTANKSNQPNAILSGPQILGESINTLRGDNQKSSLLPEKKAGVSLTFNDISAEAFSVIDENSQTVLMEKQPHKKMPIASLTKLMTVLVAYEKLNPDDYYTISKEDILDISPSLSFVPNEEIKFIDLMEAALVCSVNDAAGALANAVQEQSTENFTWLMNQKAAVLGLSETNFSNPLGFDNEMNFSSVNDLKKLAFHTQNLAIFKNLGERTDVKFTSKTGRQISCKASNKLVGKNLEIENVKTGYTARALGSMIAKITRNEKKILIIIVGSQNREADLLALAEQAFQNYEWQ